ncbi:MAG: GntR family transcriptional regulator [Deltaproteobacteria bacterium]|nr:GntR family transcriptional regulator [Deltaproteobacteria bacterium]
MTGALRQEIYSGLRLPRERLVEVSLAETFSVSRMVIRQVLNMLKAEGLVGIEPYKGASVASISIDRIFQNYQVDFHRIINLRCGNDRLIQLIRQHIQFTTYWFLVLSAPGRITQNIKEHEDALKAFEKKDGEKARKFMERHIMGAGEYLTKHLEMSLPAGMLG